MDDEVTKLMAWDDAIKPVEPDGLIVSDVGPWMDEKHRLLATYASLFARSMRGKWDELVYLDLFSGPGQCRVRGTNRHYHSSPLTVLTMSEKFDRYVFCDANPENVQALKARCRAVERERKVSVLGGDANRILDEVLAEVPRGSRTHRVLSFCFLDPCQISNLKFETIRVLSARYLDFLILIPSGMDAHRNEQNYTRESNVGLDEFLGNTDWRARWEVSRAERMPFERFVVIEFGRSMRSLKYIDPGLENSAVIRSQDKNLLLYRLMLYSRNQLGAKFWKETRTYANPQVQLEF